MGFGYLLLGYVITYVIYITASAAGIGSLMILGGSALMFLALRSLCRFQDAFQTAKWLTLPIFAVGLFRLWQDAANWFLWQNTLGGVMSTVLTWASFAVTLVFHFSMLYAIRVLALEVELKKLSTHAMYNTLGVGVWGSVYLLCNMPSMGERLLPYLGVSMTLFNLLYLISDVILLLRCAKNICAEGDEEIEPQRSRFAWVNRIGDSYNRTMDTLKQNSRADGDAFWSERMKKNEQKKNSNSKHKKKKKK